MTKTPQKLKAAVIGSGNIGTDLIIKLQKSDILEPTLLVGIDPQSEGLARARDLGVATLDQGIGELFEHAAFAELAIVFDATSAKAHLAHAPRLQEAGKPCVDLTPAAVGPYAVPVVNLEQILAQSLAPSEGAAANVAAPNMATPNVAAPNVNMVTCGGQATIPIVAAMKQVGEVPYAEIVASISSRSAGPGTRANIDEFTRTTAEGLEQVGGAGRGKAIIVLNPAEPPLIMRDTVHALVQSEDRDAIAASIREMVKAVQSYVPGYRLVQDPVFEEIDVVAPDLGRLQGTKVSVFLEVEGAGDWLPKYAGNLDIMTAAALRMGEEMVRNPSVVAHSK